MDVKRAPVSSATHLAQALEILDLSAGGGGQGRALTAKPSSQLSLQRTAKSIPQHPASFRGQCNAVGAGDGGPA